MCVFAYQISSFKFPTAKGTPKKPTQIRVKKIFNLLPVYRDDMFNGCSQFLAGLNLTARKIQNILFQQYIYTSSDST